ncbi:MAG: DUF4271 domain-containing protein [Bacteroidales bacterium]|nr:DUF4271 domain-containing protein [Bacteroidales bacterium]
MIDGPFLSGTLEMPQSLADAAFQAEFVWNGVLFNRILAIACVILGMIVISDTVQIFPRLVDCIFRWRACLSMEHSLGDARARNSAASVSILALSLVTSRYCLYGPSFLFMIPEWSMTLICIGVVISYFLLRLVLFLLLNMTSLRGDERKAVIHSSATFCIPTTVMMLFTMALLDACGAPDGSIRVALIAELGLGWLISLVRTGQIIGSHYSGFTTFLYLCALEILPAAAVVASALVL